MSIELDNVANAEWSRTKAQEGVWLTIDGLGTFRNICAAIGSAGEIVGTTAAKVASVAAGGIIPISFMLGGAFVLGSAAIHNIPKALEECRGAEKDLEIAMQSMDPDQRRQQIELADEGITAAALGLTNQSLYGLMGAGMIQCGVVTLMSPVGAQLFGFAPLVSAGAATASGGALGAVYAVRGAVVLGKSVYSLIYLNKFEKDFKESLKLRGTSLAQTVDTAIEKIEKIGTLPNALGRRIGDNASKLLDPGATLEDKIRYLEAVDKGIQERKLQEILSAIIGVAMILGGLAAIAAVFVCAPATIGVISLVSAVFFVAMESVYGTYDSSFLFSKLRDKLYTPSDEIAALKNAYRRETNTRLKGLDLAMPKRLEELALNQRMRAQEARISQGGIHLIPTSFQRGQNGLKKTA
jgi:hypothetical protein